MTLPDWLAILVTSLSELLELVVVVVLLIVSLSSEVDVAEDGVGVAVEGAAGGGGADPACEILYQLTCRDGGDRVCGVSSWAAVNCTGIGPELERSIEVDVVER